MGDGSKWGLSLSYIVQVSPDGLAQAFLIGESFIGDDLGALVLGDNIYHSHHFQRPLMSAMSRKQGTSVFATTYIIPGVMAWSNSMNRARPLTLMEKLTAPKSSHDLTGLYFCDNQVVEMAKSLKPSPVVNWKSLISIASTWSRANSMLKS